MAITKHRRRSMRSTRSRKPRIVGGMNLKFIFAQLLAAVALTQGRAIHPSPEQLQQQREQEQNLLQTFTHRLGGIEVEQITPHGLYIDESDVEKLKTFLSDEGLDTKVDVGPKGRVTSKLWTMDSHNNALTKILLPETYNKARA